ncbi:putative nicotinamide N-methyltransferase-like protein [Hapsidospora chrysogenum ATCC 11550]|uniref:Protein N-terminal and lysine N-methyltransferase EFM7 n=1 Tax=Hapsidospora chrysogenum (strain ATCC 11550 / CBS 779.69 / DSM 880 / IAM 14645 / JCM 23072 / IMI 49137) TaxID=857340 RepID=A0A086TAF1_HAPC1|nr:putative nicotinamide N-methyltransferase-like protein [Hapsidospora chrysogenum ATCC 11550]
MDDNDDYGMGGLMDEPEDYYPPTPPPTMQTYTMRSGKPVKLHLVGASPTEAHVLWNGAKVISDYFEADPSRVEGKTVLELGAASGLPSLVAAILGAAKVVVTDYPDPELVSNMQKNIDECDETVEPRGRIAGVVDAMGFVWGRDAEPLLARLHPNEANNNNGGSSSSSSSSNGSCPARFDVLILADLLFRHKEHPDLIKTIRETLAVSRTSVAYVFFTSYRPWKRDLDMGFFDVAREAGFEVEQVEERRLDKPLFENDPGDLDVQKTVKGFEVRWPASAC